MSANVVVLDRLLAQYEPETKEARELLRGIVERILDQMWSKHRTSSPQSQQSDEAAALFAKTQRLSPKDDAQSSLKAQALSIELDLGRTRCLMYEQGDLPPVLIHS